MLVLAQEFGDQGEFCGCEFLKIYTFVAATDRGTELCGCDGVR